MEYFVDRNSIVRRIWGKGDTVLFIFAGAAAEFALNKAVDWLYFTGRLPADPLGRLFSTIGYARQIIFAEHAAAMQAIDRITAIHKGVEQNRGATIPEQAYRDVLFLLIDHSIRSFELLERGLSLTEKEEIFHVFYRVGRRMGLAGLPWNYSEWLTMRQDHLNANLAYSAFTADLYVQYKKHLGFTRYHILRQVQMLLVPDGIKRQLFKNHLSWLRPVLLLYKLSRLARIDGFVKNTLLPAAYKLQVQQLDLV